jgi:hypothetical protein
VAAASFIVLWVMSPTVNKEVVVSLCVFVAASLKTNCYLYFLGYPCLYAKRLLMGFASLFFTFFNTIGTLDTI